MARLFPHDRVARELSSQAAAMGTILAAINIPHTPGIASLLSNTADISERSRKCTEAEGELCLATEVITRLVGKLFGETRLQVRIAV